MIKLTIKENKYTIEEAKELYNELKALFGEDSPRINPMNPGKGTSFSPGSIYLQDLQGNTYCRKRPCSISGETDVNSCKKRVLVDSCAAEGAL